MFKAILTALLFISGLSAFSQISETRTVGDFSKLKAATSVKVFYTVANSKSVKVETDDTEKLQLIKTEVVNGTLEIFVDSGNRIYKKYKNVRFKTLNVYVSGPSLSSIKASSSANIKFENQNSADQVDIGVSSSASILGKFNCSEMKIDASSSSKCKAEVTAKSVEVETSSSSDVVLSGKTVRLKVDSSSSSSCNAETLLAEDVTATASSSADIDVYASKSLTAKASSSADIDYYGNPSQLATDKNSSGSVTRK